MGKRRTWGVGRKKGGCKGGEKRREDGEGSNEYFTFPQPCHVSSIDETDGWGGGESMWRIGTRTTKRQKKEIKHVDK